MHDSGSNSPGTPQQAASMVSARSDITFDEALDRHVGQFGPGQWRTVALTSIIQIPNSIAFMLWVFLCVDPIANQSWECVSPADATCIAVWSNPSSQAFCGLGAGTWRWTSTESLIARFNLVCSDAWKVQLTNSIMFVGCFIGSGVFGALCDKIGRQKPLFIATAIVSAATFVSLASTSYWFMAATRAVAGIGAAGQSHCMFLLCTEITGPVYRGRASVFSLLGFTIGEFLLAALALALPHWRNLAIAAGAINAAALLLFPLVPESARWLLSQGRQQEATGILAKVAACNHSKMPIEPLICSRSCRTINTAASAAQGASSTGGNTASSSNICSSSSIEAGVQSMGLLQLLRTPSLLIRSLVLVVTWFALLHCYYGISLGAGGLPGSVYVTFALGVAAEVVALLVAGPAVDRLGRHTVVSSGLLLGGAACLACANTRGNTAQAVLAAIGKFGCSSTESVISIWSAELFPTAVRSTAMGIFSQASRCGSIAAPFMLMMGAQLGIVSPIFLPYMVFGCVSCLAGLLVLVLPETLGAPMPESLQDLQQLQSIFSAKPWRQGCTGILAFLFRSRAASAPRRPAAGKQAANKPGAAGNNAIISITALCGDASMGDMMVDNKSNRIDSFSSRSNRGTQTGIAGNKSNRGVVVGAGDTPAESAGEKFGTGAPLGVGDVIAARCSFAAKDCGQGATGQEAPSVPVASSSDEVVVTVIVPAAADSSVIAPSVQR